MTIFFLVVFGSYFCFVLFMLYGWELSLDKSLIKSGSCKSIAVIIPIRNEENSIKHLVKSLSEIQYPKEKVEFIFVNDHSTDGSYEILNSINLENHKILDLEQNQSGKKAAITAGIEATTSEIIVTTDADCTHHPNWLNTFNSIFFDLQVNMVVGTVAISVGNSIFGKMQAIELVSLIGSGISLLHWKIPAMANGANLAFRRSIFLDVKGYEGNEDIPSGDDEYLLRKVANYSPSGVIFNHNPDSVVCTKPLGSVRTFFQQRIRWAGKWKHQTNSKTKWIAFLVFVYQCTFILALVFYFIYGINVVLILLLSKAVIEAIFLFRVGQFLKVSVGLIPFALLQIFYPIYVVITAIGSLFLSFEWKDRKY